MAKERKFNVPSKLVRGKDKSFHIQRSFDEILLEKPQIVQEPKMAKVIPFESEEKESPWEDIGYRRS